MLDLRGPIKGMHEELNNNVFSILNTEIEENNFSKNPNVYKVRLEAWRQLNSERYQPQKTIKWFLIGRKDGLKQQLESLYLKLEQYNNSIDELAAIGGQRRLMNFMDINTKRELIIEDVRKTIYELEGILEEIFR